MSVLAPNSSVVSYPALFVRADRISVTVYTPEQADAVDVINGRSFRLLSVEESSRLGLYRAGVSTYFED